MTLEIISKLIIWIFIWGLGWFGFFILNKKGIDYIKKFYLSILYFLSISIFILIIYWKEFVQYVDIKFNLTPFILILILFIFNILAYNYIRNNFKKPTKLINDNPQIFFLKLDNKYLVSKSFEILFQQILIILLTSWLYQLGFSIYLIIVSFALIFGLGHTYLIYSKGKMFGSIFTISSILSAIIFPLLIIYLPWGFVYSYILHWVFYISAGLFFWKKSI